MSWETLPVVASPFQPIERGEAVLLNGISDIEMITNNIRHVQQHLNHLIREGWSIQREIYVLSTSPKNHGRMLRWKNLLVRNKSAHQRYTDSFNRLMQQMSALMESYNDLYGTHAREYQNLEQSIKK